MLTVLFSAPPLSLSAHHNTHIETHTQKTTVPELKSKSHAGVWAEEGGGTQCAVHDSGRCLDAGVENVIEVLREACVCLACQSPVQSVFYTLSVQFGPIILQL